LHAFRVNELIGFSTSGDLEVKPIVRHVNYDQKNKEFTAEAAKKKMILVLLETAPLVGSLGTGKLKNFIGSISVIKLSNHQSNGHVSHYDNFYRMYR
jgi:hypothetical protein